MTTAAPPKAPIVIQPGEMTTVSTPYSITVGDQTHTGVVAQDVMAADPAVVPVLLGSSTPPSGIAPTKIEANTKALEHSMGDNALMLHRTYIPDWNVTAGAASGIDSVKAIVANDKAAGRIPYPSVKPPGGSWQGWKDVIARTALVKQGEQMLAVAMQQVEDGVYSFHHEGENDRDLSKLTPAQAQAHRDQLYEASCIHYDALRAIGIPDGWKLGPTWMNFTLLPSGIAQLGPLSAWHQGSDHFDHVGFDDYPTTWDDNWAFAQSQIGRNGLALPLVFGEYGETLSLAGTAVNQAAYLQSRLDWLRAHRGPGLIGACWWNADVMQAPALALLGQAIAAERALLAA